MPAPAQAVLRQGHSQYQDRRYLSSTRFITEKDAFGLVDPDGERPLSERRRKPRHEPSLTNPDGCTGGLQPNSARVRIPAFIPLLACYDLTRTAPLPASDGCPNTTSGDYSYFGHADIKEFAFYVQDTITLHNWTFNLGVRFDKYNGLASAAQGEPRLGIAYNIKPTNTVLRVSYARTMETPFNENLVLASLGMQRPGDRRISDAGPGRRLRDDHAAESRPSQ